MFPAERDKDFPDLQGLLPKEYVEHVHCSLQKAVEILFLDPGRLTANRSHQEKQKTLHRMSPLSSYRLRSSRVANSPCKLRSAHLAAIIGVKRLLALRESADDAATADHRSEARLVPEPPVVCLRSADGGTTHRARWPD